MVSNCANSLGQGLSAALVADTHEGGLDEVAHRGSLAGRLRVAVLDTSELEHALRGGGGDDAGTAGSGDETAHDRSSLARDLHGDGVGLTESAAPVAAADGDDGELGEDDGGADGSGDLLGALDTETEVAVKVTDGDEGLEAGALTGASLLLDGHDLHDLVGELGEEEIDDLVLLDGEGEEVDLLDRLDLAVLDEAADGGDGDPLRLLVTSAAARSTTSTTTTTAVTSETTTSTGSSVSHFCLMCRRRGEFWG